MCVYCRKARLAGQSGMVIIAACMAVAAHSAVREVKEGQPNWCMLKMLPTESALPARWRMRCKVRRSSLGEPGGGVAT